MGGKLDPEASTKELRDLSPRRGIHEHRDGSIDRGRDFRVRFCAGPVEYASKPLSTPTVGKIVSCSLKIGAVVKPGMCELLHTGSDRFTSIVARSPSDSVMVMPFGRFLPKLGPAGCWLAGSLSIP